MEEATVMTLLKRLSTIVLLGSVVARAGSISSGGGVVLQDPNDGSTISTNPIASCPVTNNGKLEIRSRKFLQNGKETFFFDASMLDANGKKIASFFGHMGPDGMIRFQPWQEFAHAVVRGLGQVTPALVYSATVGMVWMQHVVSGSDGNAAQGHFHQIPCERLLPSN